MTSFFGNHFMALIRNPFVVVFTLLYPLILIPIFGSAYGALEFGGLPFPKVLAWGFIAQIIAAFGMVMFPEALLSRYESAEGSEVQSMSGKLRLLGNTALAGFLVVLISIVLSFIVNAALYGVVFGGINWWYILLGMLLGHAVLFSLGFMLFAVFRSHQFILIAGFFVYLLSAQISNVSLVVPAEVLPNWIGWLASVLPVGGLESLFALAFADDSFGWFYSLILVAWTVLFTAVGLIRYKSLN